MNTTTSPKVSIVVPVHNARRYLKRCLASVCCQTLQDIEIICINDGSTDDSLNILRDFAERDSRITIIDQKNEGVANARNKGLKKAAAPYIGFIDSDDFIAPDMYEKMYTAMIMNDVDFVECGAKPMFTYKFPNEQLTRYYLSTKDLTGRVDDPDVFIDTADALWKTLFVKDILLKYQLNFMEGFCTYEDMLFVRSYKSLVKAGFYIPENLYIYFHYENSIMGKTYAKKQGLRVTETLRIIEPYYFFLKKHGIFERCKGYFWTYFEHCINAFYEWASPEIIRKAGIETIRNLIKNEDMYKLIGEKNERYYKFLDLKEDELMTLDFLTEGGADLYKKIKKMIRKIVKWSLPYFIVRLIQINTENKRDK